MEFTRPKHAPMTQQAPVEKDNPAIVRYSSMCFHCRNCMWTCLDHAGVLDRYTLENTLDNAICIYCGQCVAQCPGFAMSEKREYGEVKAKIADKDKIVIASTSPAVRASIAEAFGLPAEFSQGKLVALLKKLGFDYVLDTTFGADLTVMEEATELVHRIEKGEALPQFTSCCPSWVHFAELFYPEILPNISKTKSPIMMQGAVIKSWFAKKAGIDPEKIINVAVTPCTSKKYEIRKDGMNAAGELIGKPEMRDMDNAITTRELAMWAKEQGVDFASLEDAEYDSMTGTGAGAIFGATGGVMEAALRTAYVMINGENPPCEFYELKAVRGNESVREATVDMGKMQINVAVIFGTRTAGEFIEEMKKSGKTYHFIEVMTCPGGCSGGGGQPKGFVISGLAVPEKRVQILYDRDGEMESRLSCENPEIKALYAEMLEKPGSELAEKMLHTDFKDCSGELNRK